jgi:hypothetical protein
MVPSASSNYTSIKITVDKDDSGKQESSLNHGETTPVTDVTNEPLYAVVNKKNYQKLKSSKRQSRDNAVESKGYVPIKPLQTPPETGDQEASRPMGTDVGDYNKLLPSMPSNQDTKAKSYVALNTPQGQSAEKDVQVDSIANSSRDYLGLDQSTIQHLSADSNKYAALSSSEMLTSKDSSHDS